MKLISKTDTATVHRDYRSTGIGCRLTLETGVNASLDHPRGMSNLLVLVPTARGRVISWRIQTGDLRTRCNSVGPLASILMARKIGHEIPSHFSE